MSGPQRRRTAERLGLLYRGEAVVASLGLGLAVLLLGVLAASGWWAVRVNQAETARVREQHLRVVADLVSDMAARMLASGEQTALRTLVVDAGRSYGLSRCRIVLPDGGVVADTEPTAITVQRIPDRWEGTDAPPSEPGLRLRRIEAPGRGTAWLQVSASPAAARAPVDVANGFAVIAVVGLVSVLVLYRRLRRRMRALGVVRDVLRLTRDGGGEGRGRAALFVSSEFGEVAEAWNGMLRHMAELEERLIDRSADEVLSRNQPHKSDLSSLCDAMWQGLILVDEHLNTIYSNGAAAVFLGVKRDAMTGMPVSSFLGDETVLASVRRVARGESRHRETAEIRSARGAGEDPGVLRVSVRPVRRDDQAAALICIEDVTQQRIADEARNAFVTQATHELRTPLTNIRLYVEQALDEGEGSPSVVLASLNVINQESRRLERIVSDLLSMSEMEVGEMRFAVDDVRLDQLFREMEADFLAAAKERRIDLRFDVAPKLPIIRGDRDKLVLAIHNVLGNAIKYTPEGGSVVVRVDTDGESVTVDVSDTGIGIAENDVERVFEKFYRARDPRVVQITGSGLGLALAREVMHRHGGEISVRSQVGQGSTFTLTMPSHAKAA